MRRPTSLLILTLLVAVPAMAQTAPTPRPQRGIAVPTFAPSATAPTPMAPQSTPPAIAHPPDQIPPAATPTPMAGQNAPPRAETPRAPQIATPGNPSMGPVNIRLELAITDTFSGTPVKKSVSLLVLNGNSGMIRTTNYEAAAATLNVDAMANAYQNGLISVRLTFEYSPAPAPVKEGQGRQALSPRLNESITVVLQDGKMLMVSQSADPGSDRKVTAELTATILK